MTEKRQSHLAEETGDKACVYSQSLQNKHAYDLMSPCWSRSYSIIINVAPVVIMSKFCDSEKNSRMGEVIFTNTCLTLWRGGLGLTPTMFSFNRTIYFRHLNLSQTATHSWKEQKMKWFSPVDQLQLSKFHPLKALIFLSLTGWSCYSRGWTTFWRRLLRTKTFLFNKRDPFCLLQGMILVLLVTKQIFLSN